MIISRKSSFIKPSSIFSNNMVLQRNTHCNIWGMAEPDTCIWFKFNGIEKNIKVENNGLWECLFHIGYTEDTLSLQLLGKTSIELSNILLGDVWLCSGQSNMDMPIDGWGRVDDFKTVISNANFDKIRLLKVDHSQSNTPLLDINTEGWEICSSKAISSFSAVAYFFAKKVYEETNYPIGIIQSSVPATRIEEWMSRECLSDNFASQSIFDSANNFLNKEILNKPLFDSQNSKQELIDFKEDKKNDVASLFYNAMINPFTRFGIKGILWYQGESNVGDEADDYAIKFQKLILDWRSNFGDNSLPFFFVQLPNYNDPGDNLGTSWADFRKAQESATKLKNVFMVCAIDVGDANDIHPSNKKDIGNRLAALALSNFKNKNIVCDGPVLKSCKEIGGEIQIDFEITGERLATNDQLHVRGFELRNKDGVILPCIAKIEKTTIVLTYENILIPFEVRYAWRNNPDCNLTDASGLPAHPFRIKI